MRLRDKLYAATEEATKALKKPFVEKKVNRALDGAVDSLESQKIDYQERVDQLTAKLVNGDTSVIRDLIEYRIKQSEADDLIAQAKSIRVELDATVAEEK